jgi:hypothetical protein
MHFLRMKVPATAIWLVGVCLANSAVAATATADIGISLAVSSPSCKVTNSKGALQLPTATNSTLSLGNYLTAHGITTPGVGMSNRVTSPALEITTTITCSEPTVITGFLVAPAPGSVPWAAGWVATQFLVDSSTPPVAFFGGAAMLEYEQVSIDKVPAGWSYTNYSGLTRPYSTAFLAKTASASEFISEVTWRPTFYNSNSAAKVGKPTGDVFTGAARVTVDY